MAIVVVVVIVVITVVMKQWLIVDYSGKWSTDLLLRCYF